MKYLVRIPLALLAIALACVVSVAAILVGGYYYVVPSVPAAAELRNTTLQRPLAVYSRDRELIYEFGEKRRTPVDYENVPPLVIDAILATEDEHFFEHPGVDWRGVIRGIVNELSPSGSTVGGSTITQQVPRTLNVLSRSGLSSGVDKFVNKFKEWILAFRIEQEFTKPEILELYMNTSFFGQRSYGIVTAAYTYFGKTLDELTISEIAILAGIPQRPSEWNPLYSVENARNRRNYVLRRMLETGAIDQAKHDAAVADPVVARYFAPRQELYAPYVAEMARQFAVELLGEEKATTEGYRVITSVDSRLQRAANAATLATLRSYDENHGYKGPLAHVDVAELDGLAPEAAERRIEEWLARHPDELDMRAALVLDVTPETAAVRFAADDDVPAGTVAIPFAAVEWAGRYVSDSSKRPLPATMAEVLAPGDIVFLRRDADGNWRLAQDIEVEGAFVAIDPRDGAIVALTGGSDYVESKFNRATQSRRQPGSTFKPFVLSAALEAGVTAATIVSDAKLNLGYDPVLETQYRPANYGDVYHGDVRVREALVESMNMAFIRILKEHVGYARAAEHARRFGFSEEEVNSQLGAALVLGVSEVAPVTLVNAFATFANGGFRVEHYFIDRIETYDGKVVYESQPRFACGSCGRASAPSEAQSPQLPAFGGFGSGAAADATSRTLAATATAGWPPAPPQVTPFAGPPNPAERVISPQNAYLVADMMRDVITDGSGRRALALGRSDLAGKTGTTNDLRDTWFVGFNDRIVAGAWVGFDLPRPLGPGEQGGRTAIPMWIDFMREALKGVPDVEPPRPPNIIEYAINPRTGEIASDLNPNTIKEVFERGHVPNREPDHLYAPSFDPAPLGSGEPGAPGPSTSSGPSAPRSGEPIF